MVYILVQLHTNRPRRKVGDSAEVSCYGKTSGIWRVVAFVLVAAAWIYLFHDYRILPSITTYDRTGRTHEGLAYHPAFLCALFI